MKPNAPIVIVDNDLDDLELIKEVHQALKLSHELILLTSGEALISYLHNTTESPFLIISDFNLPMVNGFDLRRKILEDLQTRYKSIPYVIWSTGANEVQVKKGFDNYVQGFFLKPASIEKLQATYSAIITYWTLSLQPKM